MRNPRIGAIVRSGSPKGPSPGPWPPLRSLLALWILIGSFVPLSARPERNPRRVLLNEVCAANAGLVLDPHSKQFSDWLELHNPGRRPVDLSGWVLSDDLENPKKWTIPAGTLLPPGQCLLFWADRLDIGLHTNFKLSPAGGMLLLSSPAGKRMDQVAYPAHPPDLSYGRSPRGHSWAFQASPTPGHPNDGIQAASGKPAPPPVFSVPAGFHARAIQVGLTSVTGGTIRYTLDGSLPTRESNLLGAPLLLEKTAVIRARVFPPAGLPSPCASATYFIGERFTVPVVSVVMDPRHLWDEETGMYALGKRASPTPPHYGANYREHWERPASVEFYETDGRQVFSQYAGVRIHGSVTRSVPQKSLGFYAGARYGAQTFSHALFPGQVEQRSYPNFMLRNSGNDWPRTLFRDGLTHTLVRGRMDLDIQEYRPSVLFLNGAYWGILNLRERLDRHYLEAHHRVPGDGVDLLEHFGKVQVLEGSATEFETLLEFIDSHDLSTPEAYAEVKERIDIQEFIDYHIVEVFVGNVDWPVGNVKLWRERKPGSRWRWMLYDTDLGFALDPIYGADFDMIWLLLDPVGDPWPNPPWSTFLFRHLAKNRAFRREFVQRFEQHLASTFHPDRVVAVIDAMQAVLEPEMARQIGRWKGQSDGFLGLKYPETMDAWRAHVEALRSFARERPAQVRRHLAKHFGSDSPGK